MVSVGRGDTEEGGGFLRTPQSLCLILNNRLTKMVATMYTETTNVTRVIFVLLSLLAAPTATSGVFSGENTVNAVVTVGATASCTAVATEIPLDNLVPDTVRIATVTVSCPGAGWSYLGVVGSDGRVGARTCSDVCPSYYSGAVYWASAIMDNDRPLPAWLTVNSTDGSMPDLFSSPDPSNGLPPYVGSLAKGTGSKATFTVDLETACNGGTGKCRLKTGSYPYQMKTYGYWQ